MMKPIFKKALPHLIAIVGFFIASLVYNLPAMQGKVLYQNDVIQYKAMAQQSLDYREKHGHFPLWTQSMFSGMPAFNIAMEFSSPINVSYLSSLFTFGLPKPINFFFLACISFYILSIVLGFNVWVGILTSIAYAYSTYNPILAAVGHETKLLAIAYIPMIVAGLLLIFKRKYLIGAALFTLSVSMQAGSEHLQVIYYTGIIIAFITGSFIIQGWKNKQLKQVLLSTSIAMGAGVIGFLTFAQFMLPVQEYAKETMRGGKSELTQNSKNKSVGGLDKDYAFHWSFSITEPLTMLVPGLYGGGNAGKILPTNSKFVDKLNEVGVGEEVAISFGNSCLYWGGMSAPDESTSGPVYIGAIICYLFILGLVLKKKLNWILPLTIFGIVLAWGKNFPLNYFLFDFLPFYNKFRAPSLAMVIPQFTFPLVAGMMLNELVKKKITWERLKKANFVVCGVFGFIFFLYFLSDFKGLGDNSIKDNIAQSVFNQLAKGKQGTQEMQQQALGVGQTVIHALQDDRKSVFLMETFKSLLFVALAALAIGLFFKEKVKLYPLIFILIFLSSYDLLAEGKKYLNDSNYVDPLDIEAVYQPTAVDRLIDNDKNVRVFDQTSPSPFSDSHISYFHNSVGGYHPAKLALYDDIIKNQLAKGNVQVYNMLNAKYFITPSNNGTKQVSLNTQAFGNCWFVKGIKYVKNSDEEMQALTSNIKDSVVIQSKYTVKNLPTYDSGAKIHLVEDLNDKLTYTSSSKTNQFAVFSEVYYGKGWKAYVDGKETKIIKVDYILRGMEVPAGEHKVEFIFAPQSYVIGGRISVLCALILYALLALAIIMQLNQNLPQWMKRKI